MILGSNAIVRIKFRKVKDNGIYYLDYTGVQYGIDDISKTCYIATTIRCILDNDCEVLQVDIVDRKLNITLRDCHIVKRETDIDNNLFKEIVYFSYAPVS